jgi:MOSC domain-containing protein YiiM
MKIVSYRFDNAPPALELVCSDDSIEESDSDGASTSHSSPDNDECSSNKPNLSVESGNLSSPTKQGSNTTVGFSVQGLYARKSQEEKALLMGKDVFLARKRIKTRPIQIAINSDEDEYECAMFVPETGLANIGEPLWHKYGSEHVREDRAILFQSQENYEHLLKHERFKSCFDGTDYMENPTFGEQVIVNGCDTSEMAIGDIFEIEGGYSTLRVEITAPRKPCATINQKHGTPFGKDGMQLYCLANGLAGWFAKVLVAGELREGMRFTRTAHPNPKWTLAFTRKVLYCEGNKLQTLMCAASWNRDRSELEELLSLPQLGEYEWKVEARKLLLKLDGIDPLTVSSHLIDPQINPTPEPVPSSSGSAEALLAQTQKKDNAIFSSFGVDCFKAMIMFCFVFILASLLMGRFKENTTALIII